MDITTKKIIAIDLETIANPRIKEILPEVSAAKNLKNHEKIKDDIEKKKAKQISDMGLNPHYNMICCAGWCNGETSGHIMLKDESDESEKDLLIEYWEILSKYQIFITFNGRQFDIPCLLFHGIQHNIIPGVKIDNGRYNRGNHVDLRLILTNNDTKGKGKLDFFLQRYLGIRKMEGIDGSKVQRYWDNFAYKEIADYCMDDCKKTFQLFEKLNNSGLID